MFISPPLFHPINHLPYPYDVPQLKSRGCCSLQFNMSVEACEVAKSLKLQAETLREI